MRDKMAGYVNSFATVFVYAFSGVFIVGLAKYVGMYSTIFWRGVFCLTICLGILLIDKAVNRSKFGYVGKYNSVDLLTNYFVPPVLMVAWVFAVLIAGANTALFFVLVSQQLVTLIINWVKKGRPNRITILANILMLLGVMVFSYPLISILSLGVLMAVVYGTTTGFKCSVVHEMKVVNLLDRVTLLFGQSVVIVIVGTLMILLGGRTIVPTTGVPFEGWMVVLGASVVILLTQFMEMFSLSKIDANINTVIGSSELAVAGVINWLIIGQMMTSNQWIGSFILIISMAVVPVTEYYHHKLS